MFDRPRELLEVIEENIPAMIQSNEELLDHISHCRIDANESRETYEKMMVGLETLKHQLLEYGTGQIYVDDFIGREIRLRDDYNDYGDSGDFRCSAIILNCSNNTRGGDRRIQRGIWTALQNASLYDEEEKRDEAIIIKVYLPLAGISETFAEVTKLRFLDHPCVAKFLGIHHSDSPIPAFVYMDHLRSLKIYRESTFCNLRVEIPRFLEEVVYGLEYLHSKKLVHMELCQNTITVDFDGNVKLTGGCLPRLASFPMDKESIGVGDFAYLSPDVLRGEIYVACADVYALGLLIFELLLNTRCFDNQRMMTLDLFTSKVDPIGMNDVINKCQEVNMTESTKNLIVWCMDPSADKRPPVQVIAEKMSDFKTEQCAQNLRRSGFQTRRHQAVKRVPSKQAS
ncbi:serine/threonine-protein kinase Nek7-like [Saccostrea cucullata]|uniref:serine/threonine-protein kinase Nek7-like n=1 Tax=Saccostrea cuccullata TaxID=36930 RepID=UPI002ED3C1E5